MKTMSVCADVACGQVGLKHAYAEVWLVSNQRYCWTRLFDAEYVYSVFRRASNADAALYVHGRAQQACCHKRKGMLCSSPARIDSRDLTHYIHCKRLKEMECFAPPAVALRAYGIYSHRNSSYQHHHQGLKGHRFTYCTYCSCIYSKV
jgi:hypothetical protein